MRSKEKLCSFICDRGSTPFTLVLTGKGPLLRATRVWPLLSSLQKGGIERQVCQLASSFMQLKAHCAIPKKLLMIRKLILNIFYHSYTYMVCKWSKVQTIVPPVELKKCLKWIGLLVSSGYLYKCDYMVCPPVQEIRLILQIFYWNKQLHIHEWSPWIINTRPLIILLRLSRTGTTIIKRLFFPFYQKWFNFLHWVEN